MILYNKEYSFSRGKGKITFSEGKNNVVNAIYSVYNDYGTITGILNGDKLEATFHSTSLNKVGLIHFVFSGEGFQAKWKSGLELGQMRGKWFTSLPSYETIDSNEDCFINLNYWSWKEISDIAGIEDPMDIEDYEKLKLNFESYYDLLIELYESLTINGTATNIKIAVVILEAGRLFGKLAWLANRNSDSTEYWCKKWGSFNDSVYLNCDLSSNDYLALGQQYHLDFQPMFQGEDENESKYPEEWFHLAYEKATTAGELIDLIQYGLFSEYFSFEDIANESIRKAWELEKSVDVAVQLLFDDNEEKKSFIDDELFEEIVNDLNEIEHGEDGRWSMDELLNMISNSQD